MMIKVDRQISSRAHRAQKTHCTENPRLFLLLSLQTNGRACCVGECVCVCTRPTNFGFERERNACPPNDRSPTDAQGCTFQRCFRSTNMRPGRVPFFCSLSHPPLSLSCPVSVNGLKVWTFPSPFVLSVRPMASILFTRSCWSSNQKALAILPSSRLRPVLIAELRDGAPRNVRAT